MNKEENYANILLTERIKELMMEMKNILAIGSSDFKELIKNSYFYIDKSMFIKELIDNKYKVVLITRPRRFGKSLNMSMLHHFLNINENSKDLFKDLKIMKEGEKYTSLINTYPVVNISFNGIKSISYAECTKKIRTSIVEAYDSHNYLTKSSKLTKTEKDFIQSVVENKIDESIYNLEDLIFYLTKYLTKHFGKKVIVLLDEYDVPLLNSYTYDYYQKAVAFFGSFIAKTFKDNVYLEKGILTGVSRVSKESIFTDGNNIKVYTMLDEEFSEYFGFTEEEVKGVLKKYNLTEHFNEIKKWYNGYNIGNKTNIYNPWSILNFFASLEFRPYWVNTSGNELIKRILEKSTKIKPKLEKLIVGEEAEVKLDLNTVIKGIEKREKNIWGLFFQAGYLKVVGVIDSYENKYLVKLPNFEIRNLFASLVETWFTDVDPDVLIKLYKYLTTLDLENFELLFKNLCLEMFSILDVGKNTDENFYHAFTLGMLLAFKDNYIITSNRESGEGRYDVCLEPFDKDKPAFIMEFKSCKDASFEKAIASGKKQIEDKKYEIDLRQRKCINIKKMVFAFKGKRVKIETF